MDYNEEANEVNINKLLDKIDLGEDDETNNDSNSIHSDADL